MVEHMAEERYRDYQGLQYQSINNLPSTCFCCSFIFISWWPSHGTDLGLFSSLGSPTPSSRLAAPWVWAPLRALAAGRASGPRGAGRNCLHPKLLLKSLQLSVNHWSDTTTNVYISAYVQKPRAASESISSRDVKVHGAWSTDGARGRREGPDPGAVSLTGRLTGSHGHRPIGRSWSGHEVKVLGSDGML